MVLKRLLLVVSFLLGTACYAQTFQVSGTVKDSNGTLYQNGSGRAVIVTPGNQQPTVNGSAIQSVYPISSLGSFATFSLPLYSNFAISPAGSQYTFSFCDQTQQFCFTTTPITISSQVDLTNFIQPQAAILPLPGTSSIVSVNGSVVTNPNFIDSATVVWSFVAHNIQATVMSTGGQSFATLSTGTNTQAIMTVGTGASLLTSGSGTIAATSVPFSGVLSGTNVSASLIVASGSSLTFSGTGLINASRINGTSVPVNSLADQALITSAAATGLWSSLPLCLDTSGQHLNYNTSAHMFSCGTSGGTAGSAAFNTITSGTNSQAAMVVGTGASLTTSGSGTIAATSSPFAGLTSGTNATAAMVIGTGASLTISGSGTNNANLITGTTVPTNSAADQYLGTTASATGQWATMPSCLDSGGNHINYNTSTHAFSCGTSGGSAGSAAFNTITSGTNTQAAMLVGTGASLAATGTGTITATGMPFGGLSTDTNTTATLTVGTGASLTFSGTGSINASLINGTSITVNSASDQAIVTTAAATGSWTSLPPCLDTGGQHLNYNTSIHAFACGTTSSGGGGGGTPGGNQGEVQLRNGSTFGAVTGLQVDSVSVPTTFINPLDFEAKGPNYATDIRFYGARGGVTINTTGTGSGTSVNIGVSTFVNGDGITIAGGGSAPAIAAPAGLSASSGWAAGMTVPDAVMVNAVTGSSTYQYRLFACDVFDGCTVPTSTVTTTTAISALGQTQIPISTWSLTGNTLTIVTSVPHGFVAGTYFHSTGTSNNALAGGWYPISSVTNSTTFVVNNVPQTASTTTSGTGGIATAMAGNLLSWTASTGGTVNTRNMPWEYFVCAQRPGDGAMHIIGRSFPSTSFAESNSGNFSTTFVDFGSTITANPQIPWDISDANCTAVAAQNEMFTTTVASGGGTTVVTLASPLPNSVSGAVVKRDDGPAMAAAGVAAHNFGGSFYIPIVSGGFIVNSFTVIPFDVSVWQAGTMTVNAPIQVQGSTNWMGITGIAPTPAFGFNGAPVITCNAWPCIYVGGTNNQATGGTTFDTLTFNTPTQNGLEMLVDANWGMIWNKVNMQSGANNNDNMGMDLVIRPGASNYHISNSNFVGGPNQVVDQTWAPLVYATRGHAGCCGGGGGASNISMVNTQWNRRGFYMLANGGQGIQFNSTSRAYRQGGITPFFTAQNINGNVTGQIELDNVFHDTESQAGYAWICNLSCSGGFGVPIHYGFGNVVSQDTGTIPAQLTGGGNQPIAQVVAAVSPGGAPTSTAFGTIQFGSGWYIQNGVLVPTIPISFNNGVFPGNDIRPNVPTPMVSLESGSLFGNLVAGTLTANRTYTFPDASGTVCITTTCGGQFYQTIQDNAVAQTQRPILNVIPGTNMTINCVDNIGATRTDCTFISSSSASTAWASITAGTNSNAGTFTATGNTWSFSGASGFSLPSGTTIPGSGSGAVSLVTQAAAGTPTITFGTSSGTPAVTASSPLALNTTTGNMICATCVTSSGGGAITGVAPISVSAAGAVSISAATTGALGSIQLTNNLGGTGASPTVVSTTITGFTVNRIVKFDSGGNLINSAASEASSVFTVPEILDNTTFPYVQEIANEAVTGTTLNKWASLTGAPSTVKVTAAGATGAIGIIAGGASTTGSAQVAVLGRVNCVFDAGTTANHFVSQSASVAGDCTDAGATAVTGMPTAIVLSTNAVAGTYAVEILGGSGGSGGGGSGTINACAAFATNPIAYYSASTTTDCDANIVVSAGAMTLGIAGSTAGSLILSGSSSGAVSLKTQAIAGTYNFNLPITAGTSTFLLTSGGGSTAPMTWTSPSITVNGVSCTLGSTCTTMALSTNSVANASQTALNFLTSTGNVIGLTVTPSNPGTSQEIFEVTGIATPAGGGTGVSTPTAHALLVAEGAAAFNLIPSPSVNGYYLCGFNVIASTPVDPTCNPLGVPVDAQVGTTYTIGTSQSDRATLITANNAGAQTYTAVNPTNPAFGSNFPYVIKNIGTGTVTEVSSGFNIGGGTSLLIPPSWTVFHWSDNVNYIVSRLPDFGAFPNCVDTGGNHLNFTTSTGLFSCGTSGSGGGGGTVTSIVVSAPMTGGTITTTGTIGFPTAVTSAASLTNTAIVIGQGLQASATDASATLVSGALTLSGGGSVTLGGSSSGTFAITVDSAAATLNLGPSASVTSGGVLTVTSCSGCAAGTTALSSITAATASNTIANGNRPQVWNWTQSTASQAAFTFGETAAATGGGQTELGVTTILGSTAIPLVVTQSINGTQNIPALKIVPTWNTSGVVDAALLVNVANTGSGPNSLLFDLQVGGVTQFKVDKAGNITSTGLQQYSGSGAIALPGTAHFVPVAEGATVAAAYVTPTANVGWCFLSNGLSSDPSFQACPSASVALSSVTAATGANTIANANNGAQVWGWKQTTASQTAFTINDTTAATGSGDILMAITTAAASTEIPLVITNSLGTGQGGATLKLLPTWNTAAVVDAAFLINVTNTASGVGSELMDLEVGGVSQFFVDRNGNGTFTGTMTSNAASLGAATATSLLATGNVDGLVPVAVTTAASLTLGGTFNSGYTFNQQTTAGNAITFTLPTAAVGKQYCVGNGHGSVTNTGIITVATSAAGQLIIFTDGTLSASGGNVTSAGAARDNACFVGVSTTAWMMYVQSGVWTKH